MYVYITIVSGEEINFASKRHPSSWPKTTIENFQGLTNFKKEKSRQNSQYFVELQV